MTSQPMDLPPSPLRVRRRAWRPAPGGRPPLALPLWRAKAASPRAQGRLLGAQWPVALAGPDYAPSGAPWAEVPGRARRDLGHPLIVIPRHGIRNERGDADD